MPEGDPLRLDLPESWADYLRQQSIDEGVPPDEVVRRALGLYAALISELRAGNQALVWPLEAPNRGETQQWRLDFYRSPSAASNLELHPELSHDRHFRAGVMIWPPIN